MAALEGVTAIDTNVGLPTVMVAEVLIEPETAVMVAVPWPELVASPQLPTALPIITTAEDDELQVAVEVRSCVLPSVKVPVAVNCCVVPKAIEGFCGLIAIETSAAGFTTNVAVALIAPEPTPMVVVPALSVVASPFVPTVLLIVATTATVELHCPLCVRSCVVPSVNVPVAVNCCVVPRATVAVWGVITIDTSVAEVTVSIVEALTAPEAAEMFAVPAATLCASPALLIVAVEGVSEDQVAVLVMFCVLPSE